MNKKVKAFLASENERETCWLLWKLLVAVVNEIIGDFMHKDEVWSELSKLDIPTL